MKIGLYFGSFNPIHQGHLIVANTVLDKTDLDMIWFVVSPQSPDKVNMKVMMKHQERAKIISKALSDNSKMEVSTIEFGMEQPNYTYKTLEVLRNDHPDVEFSIIMGSDNANGLKQWVGIEHWMANHKLYVVERPSNYLEHNSLSWYGTDRYSIIEMPEVGISSTIVRHKVIQGESIKYLVPDSVIGDIESYYENKVKVSA